MSLYERFLEWKKTDHVIDNRLNTVNNLKFASVLAMLYWNIGDREDKFNLLIYDDFGFDIKLLFILKEIFPNMNVIAKMFYRNNIYDFFDTSMEIGFPDWLNIYITGKYTKIHEDQRINSVENEKKFIDVVKNYENVYAYIKQNESSFSELFYSLNLNKYLNTKSVCIIIEIETFYKNYIYLKNDTVIIPHSEILPIKDFYQKKKPFNDLLLIKIEDKKESKFTVEELTNIKNYNISNGEIVTFIIEDFVKKYNMKNTAEWYINKLSKIL